MISPNVVINGKNKIVNKNFNFIFSLLPLSIKLEYSYLVVQFTTYKTLTISDILLITLYNILILDIGWDGRS